MSVAVAHDPRGVAEAQDRIRAIQARQREAANRLARRQAVAPMASDELSDQEPSVKASEHPLHHEWADAVLRGEVQTATVRDIIRAVASTFGLTSADLMGPSVFKAIVRARWAAIHAVRMAKPDMSLPALGRAFGGKDHTTIRYAILKMEAEGVPQPNGTLLPLAEAAARHCRTLKREAEPLGEREGGR